MDISFSLYKILDFINKSKVITYCLHKNCVLNIAFKAIVFVIAKNSHYLLIRQVEFAKSSSLLILNSLNVTLIAGYKESIIKAID